MPFPVTASPQLALLLRGLRKSRRMTQAEVARLSGLGQKTVSLLETAPHRCSVDSLIRYVTAVRGNLSLDLKSDTPVEQAGAGDRW